MTRWKRGVREGERCSQRAVGMEGPAGRKKGKERVSEGRTSARRTQVSVGGTNNTRNWNDMYKKVERTTQKT